MNVGDLVGLGLGVMLMGMLLVATIRWEPLALAFLFDTLLEAHWSFDIGIPAEGIVLRPADVLTVVAVAAGLLRLLIRGRTNRAQGLWLLVVALLAVAFLRGAETFGLRAAGNMARNTFYFLGMVFYFAGFSYGPADLRRFSLLWLVTGGVLTVYCLVAWIDPSLRFDSEQELIRLAWSGTPFARIRVLGANSGLLLAQCALLTITGFVGGKVNPLRRMACILLLMVVVALSHRSVWVALAAGALVLPFTDRFAYAAVPRPLVYGALAVVLVGILGAGQAVDNMSSGLDFAVREPLNNKHSTLAWRTDGWGILFERAWSSGPENILLGMGFGTPFTRVIDTSTITVAPHNYYLELFLETGLVGLAAYLGFLAHLARGLWRRCSALEGALMDPPIALALLTSVVVFSIPYSPTREDGILLGILASYAAGLRAGPDPRTAKMSPMAALEPG